MHEFGDVEQAKRLDDLSRASEPTYGAIPDAEKELGVAEESLAVVQQSSSKSSTMAVSPNGQVRTVDFRNTVIIMTSNIGSQDTFGEENAEEIETKVTESLRDHFRPEFLNRIDETVIFDRLTAKDLKPFVILQLGRVRQRLAKQRLGLALAEEAKAFLGKKGYDPV